MNNEQKDLIRQQISEFENGSYSTATSELANAMIKKLGGQKEVHAGEHIAPTLYYITLLGLNNMANAQGE